MSTGVDRTMAVQADDALVQRYFGGNAGLFKAFRAACLVQFPNDLVTARAAAAAGDCAALRRVAHSLKSIFEMLGEPALSDQAQRLESVAKEGTAMQVLPVWDCLDRMLGDWLKVAH